MTEALLLAVSKSKPSKPTADVADMIPTDVDEPTDMAARVSTDDHQWPGEWSIEEEIAEEVDTEDTELDYDSVLYQQFLFVYLSGTDQLQPYSRDFGATNQGSQR